MELEAASQKRNVDLNDLRTFTAHPFVSVHACSKFLAHYASFDFCQPKVAVQDPSAEIVNRVDARVALLLGRAPSTRTERKLNAFQLRPGAPRNHLKSQPIGAHDSTRLILVLCTPLILMAVALRYRGKYGAFGSESTIWAVVK